MKRFILLIIAVFFSMAEALSAGTVIMQEIPSVCGYVKGSTTLKLSGMLNEAAIEALSKGASFSIQNRFTNYLCAPILLDKTQKGFGKKSNVQIITANSKNGKFSWTEKDVTKNFAFAIGSETIKPIKATLKSSGTLQTEDLAEFETKKATLFDLLCNKGSDESVGAYAFTPRKKGENFKFSAKEQDIQVKFSVNSKGKTNLSYKFSPAAVSPAVISEDGDPFSVTNKLYLVIDLLSETNVISYLDDVPEGGWTEEYKTTKLVLRRIEPGTFVMGSPTNELGRIPIDVGIFETQHQVTLTNAFYIGVFETTQKQYELITGMEPSEYAGATRPVESVSYDMLRGNDKGASWPYGYDVDEDSFFGKLRSKTQMTFDLPTEAQWEYACRAGTTTALNDGSNITNTYSDGSLAKLARYCFNRDDGKGGYGEHTAVGSYQPNAWGLYDMLGNVYEWCRDWFEEDLGTTPATEPYGPSVGSLRVIRGGGWSLLAYSCRSANRYYRGYPHRCRNLSGFRIVLVR